VPKLRILYDVPGWAYHRRALNLQHWAPPDFEVSIAPLARARDLPEVLGADPCDLVFVIPTHEAEIVRRAIDQRGWDTKVVGSWNSGWPLQLDAFYRAYGVTHAMVVNNRMAWERIGQLPRAHMLPNGVDLETFRVEVPIEQRAPRVLWVGSRRARRRKGYDRHLLPLQSRLRQDGIDCELLLVDSYDTVNRTAEEMATWYNGGSVLVCASEVEGTPNPALEAAACGCTVVSTAVGNMPDLIRDGENGYLVRPELNELLAAVRRAVTHYPDLARQMQSDIQRWSWRRASSDFYALFRQILAAAPLSSPVRRDLRDQLTVFRTGTDESSQAPSRVALGQQDCLFRLEERRAPGSDAASFAGQVESCKTPFFLEVDDDTALFPWALRRLFELLASSGDGNSWVAAPLHDVRRETTSPVLVLHRRTAARGALASRPGLSARAYLERTGDRGKILTGEQFRVEDAFGLRGVLSE